MRLSGLKRDVILSYKGIQIVLGHYGLIQGLTIQGVEYLGAIFETLFISSMKNGGQISSDGRTIPSDSPVVGAS